MISPSTYPGNTRPFTTAKIIGGLLSLVIMMLPVTARGKEVIYYPQPESLTDTRASYPLALLQMCSRERYDLLPSGIKAQQARNVRLLKEGTRLHVMWTVTTPEREAELLPIRIPLDRGLIGWRLLMIREASQALFMHVRNLDDFRKHIGGQGHDWPDVPILQHNGLTIATSPTYEGLFGMLAKGHIHYFPRSVAEIWTELNAHDHANGSFSAEPRLALHYPGLLYFFVNRNNRALAETLTTCLHQATADGRLKKLFYDYYRDDIARAQLQTRTVLTLSLPPQQAEVPDLPSQYWYWPSETE